MTNTGDVAGKEVVQVYYSAPYTDFDSENSIEKSAFVLGAFDKTEELQPGESENVTLTFDLEDMASYCYTHDNGDGITGCYVLEAGDYDISLCANSHDVIDSRTVTVETTIWYDNSNPRQTEIDAQSSKDDDGNPTGIPSDIETNLDSTFVAATNQFQECSDYMNEESTLLSRSDWDNTFPVMAEDRTKEVGDKAAEAFAANLTFDYETDAELGNVEGSIVYTEEMPESGASNGLMLASLRGVDYDDPEWDLLLDQIDYEAEISSINSLLFGAGYQTAELESIGKPATTEQDGDTGLNITGIATCTWMSKPEKYKQKASGK